MRGTDSRAQPEGRPELIWRATSASLRGSSHADHTPNQDAVGFTRVVDAFGRTAWVGAVSDGHGGRRYVRSDAGARLAVDVTLRRVAAAVAGPGQRAWVDLLREEIPGVVREWRAAVVEHHGDHPFTREEEALAGAAILDSQVLVAYGATLLVAVVSDDGIGIAQVGDGDALIWTHGFATRPVPGDDRLVAGETTSLCLDTAADDFRYAALPGTADAELVLLTTDGYGNSFAAADWWHGLVGDLATFVDRHGFDAFTQNLPSWLAESALVGGDDVSAVVLARVPGAVPARTLVLPDSAAPEESRAQEQDEPESPDGPEAVPGAVPAAVPEDGVHEDGVPEEGVPEEGVPEDGVPEDGVPEDGVPEDGVHEDGVHEEGVPGAGGLELDEAEPTRAAQPSDTRGSTLRHARLNPLVVAALLMLAALAVGVVLFSR